MAGLGIKVFCDEDLPHQLAAELRGRGYDAESCVEVGRHNRRIPDEDQLAYAAHAGRAILTFNSRDYVPLAGAWAGIGKRHSGIIVSPQIADFGDLLRRVMRHLDHVDPATQADTVLWL